MLQVRILFINQEGSQEEQLLKSESSNIRECAVLVNEFLEGFSTLPSFLGVSRKINEDDWEAYTVEQYTADNRAVMESLDDAEEIPTASDFG